MDINDEESRQIKEGGLQVMVTEGRPDSAERYRGARRATAKVVAEAKLRNGRSLEMPREKTGAGSPKDVED